MPWWGVKQILFLIFWGSLLAAVGALIGYFTNIFVVLPLTIFVLAVLASSKYQDGMKDWDVVHGILVMLGTISIISMWAALVIAQPR